jgi:hypothetical protein
MSRSARFVSEAVKVSLRTHANWEQVGSARLLERLYREHLRVRRMCGGVSVNYHTLAAFWVAHPEILEDLLATSFALSRPAACDVWFLKPVCSACRGTEDFYKGPPPRTRAMVLKTVVAVKGLRRYATYPVHFSAIAFSPSELIMMTGMSR